MHGRSKDKVDKVVKDLNELKKGKAVAVVGDLSKDEGVRSVIEQTDKIGELDVLVNNAGQYEVANLEKQSNESLRRMFEVNVMSVFNLSRHYLPKMLKRKTGRIINISSIAGMREMSSMIGYSITKSALDGLTRNLAELTRGTSVTVNSLCVGPTATEGIEAEFNPDAKKSFTESLPQLMLLGRWLEADEIASAVAYLASKAGVIVNGTAQRADGGVLKQF